MEYIKQLRHKLKYSLISCLIFLQLFIFSIPSLARISREDLSPTIATTATELEYIMDLSLRTMLNKKVYLYINETLNKAATSDGFKGETKNLISQTKLVFMLANLPLEYEKLEKILIDINKASTEELHDSNDKKTAIAELDEILQKVIEDKAIFKKLISEDSYEQPLVVFDVLEAKGKKTIKRLGYESMDVFVNHPRYEDPDNVESRIIPKDDHKAVMVNLIKEAKSGDSIYFNFYDFDLKELAEALVDAKVTSAEWKNWQENIRVSPNWFNGGSVSHNGKEYPWQVKLHHKIIILADQNISNPGSSINFSEAGEANQEQIIIVYSRRVTKAIRGAVKYLWDVVAGPNFSVVKEVERRNAKNSEELIKLAYKVEKYRNNISASSQCLKTYSKASGISQAK